jgi:DNA-binding NarL/FixJ family response regulator
MRQEYVMATPSFLIVDDHPLFLEALQSALEHGFPGARIDVADSIGGARRKLGCDCFNLVLLDLRMPDAQGFEGLAQVRSDCPKTPLAVISSASGPDIVSKVKSIGADGFINKGQRRQDILKCVSSLLNGARSFPAMSDVPKPAATQAEGVIERLKQLTPQQFKVLTRVCEAKLNKQIAFELGVTETTIKAHITLIFKKLGVHSRTQAVLLMQRIRSELEDTEFGALLSAQA